MIGGEGGIRTLSLPVESVTYRFQIARVAVDAGDAVGPCSILPDVVSRRPHAAGGQLAAAAWLSSSSSTCSSGAMLTLFVEREHKQREPGHDGDVLPSADTIGDWAAVDSGS
jgi:hypothetical protein